MGPVAQPHSGDAIGRTLGVDKARTLVDKFVRTDGFRGGALS